MVMTANEFKAFSYATAEEMQKLGNLMAEHFGFCDYDILRRAIIRNKMNRHSIIDVLSCLTEHGVKVQVDQDIFMEFIGEMFNHGYQADAICQHVIHSQAQLIK